MREMTARQLDEYLQGRPLDQLPQIIDVRQPWEYEICRLANSRLIPMAQIPDNLDQLDARKDTVVVCHHGIRSRAVARFLEQHGFDRVINLAGGVDEWAKTVDRQFATY